MCRGREGGRKTGDGPGLRPQPHPGGPGARSLTQRWGLLFQTPETPSATYQKSVDARVCVCDA